jgi:hypothetical protein
VAIHILCIFGRGQIFSKTTVVHSQFSVTVSMLRIYTTSRCQLMKFTIFFTVLMFSKLCYSQDVRKTAIIKIERFNDSVFNERDAEIRCKLVNESNSILTITDPPFVYCGLVRSRSGKCDTINTQRLLKRIDGYTPASSKKFLLPGESKDFSFSLNLYGYGSTGLGQVRLKIFYGLKAFNKDVLDAESNWVSQYFPKIY